MIKMSVDAGIKGERRKLDGVRLLVFRIAYLVFNVCPYAVHTLLSIKSIFGTVMTVIMMRLYV